MYNKYVMYLYIYILYRNVYIIYYCVRPGTSDPMS